MNQTMTKNDQQNITRLFDKLIEQIRKMLTLLDNEAKLLSSRDIDTFEKVTREKMSVALELDRLTKALPPILNLDTELANHDRHESQNHSHPNQLILDTDLAKQWSEILGLLHQCKNFNESNGAGIDLLKQHYKRYVDFLTPSNDVGNTYGPNGIEDQSLASRSHSVA